MTHRIEWSPVVPREKIRRLYEGEAAGITDTEVLEDVGMRLLMRCESILLVSSRRVRCPICGQIFALEKQDNRCNKDDVYKCPTKGCSWQTTWGEYHQSWTKRRLFGGKALSAFRAYMAAYPRARTTGAKMIAVDQLLHAFHWDLRAEAPNRLAADNLIDGNHGQVLRLLEEISGGDGQDWATNVERMRKRRGEPFGSSTQDERPKPLADRSLSREHR